MGGKALLGSLLPQQESASHLQDPSWSPLSVGYQLILLPAGHSSLWAWSDHPKQRSLRTGTHSVVPIGWSLSVCSASSSSPHQQTLHRALPIPLLSLHIRLTKRGFSLAPLSMSSISSSLRRPSTALTTSLSSSTRLPYEAAEALLWERQNARANMHLHAQMKELQAVHDAYDARIKATEAVAEAAEAAVSRVRELGRKVEAIEADEREGPFVRWCKEAIGQLQISVDGMKGVRQRVSAFDAKMERLEEDVGKVRDEGGVVKNVLRRLEVLEGERREEGSRYAELEKEVKKLRDVSHRREDSVRREGEGEEMVEETYDEALVDDNPLAVFYGIETQSPARREESPTRRRHRECTSTATHQQVRSPSRLVESPTRRQVSSVRCQDPSRASTAIRHQIRSPSRPADSAQRRYDDLQPTDEDMVRPEDDSFRLLESEPEVEYGWENTQQFKNMQKELEALRAMCRTQEPKSSNETADTTQHPQETQLVRRENNIEFSDAITETEIEYNGASSRFCKGAPQDPVDALR